MPIWGLMCYFGDKYCPAKNGRKKSTLKVCLPLPTKTLGMYALVEVEIGRSSQEYKQGLRQVVPATLKLTMS